MKKSFSIKHSIKGRLRIKINHTSFTEEAFPVFEASLSKLEGVFFVRSNTACKSVVINYDNSVLQLNNLLSFIERNLGTGIPHKPQKNQCIHCETCSINSEEKLVKPALTRFGILSAVMGGVFVRSTVMGIAVSQSLLSPLGIVAAVFSLPLIYDGYQSFKKKKFGLDAFLGGGCIASVVSGQALTALEILWINSGAELLQAWITERSRKSIAGILQATSHHTFKLVEGVEVEVKTEDLKKGDIVVLHTGEKICIDGEIIDGNALIDESPITGRSDFIPRNIGDTVLAGTFVRQGLIYVCAEKVGDETYLSRILCQVEDSLKNKAPVELVADRLAKNLVRFGLAATGITYLLTQNIWRAFTVMLVMACPCATVLAASTAVSAAMNAAVKRKILIKGGKYLEQVGTASCICFDKTGTLTTTEPELVDIILLKESNTYYLTEENRSHSEKEALLQMLVSAESHNHHPLAAAIKHEAQKHHIEAIPHTFCEYFLGMGILAEVLGNEIIIGNAKIMQQHGIDIQDKTAAAHEKTCIHSGQTMLYVAKNKELIALLTFDNILRKEAQSVIQTLKNSGIAHTYLITGDEYYSAQKLCSKLGIETFYSSVMPEDKGAIIKELQEKHGAVIMIGDGINDAMALAHADIGIAMGDGGSEVAVEAADITLVDDNLNGIVYVHALSKQTIKIVYQNFWIATGSNLAGLFLAAFGILSPVTAGLLHIAHTMGVLANSTRLVYYDIKKDPKTLPYTEQS